MKERQKRIESILRVNGVSYAYRNGMLLAEDVYTWTDDDGNVHTGVDWIEIENLSDNEIYEWLGY